MQRHRLRGVLDQVRRQQPARGAQRIVRMRVRGASCSGWRSRPTTASRSSRHIVPLCGMRRAMPARSSVWGAVIRLSFEIGHQQHVGEGRALAHRNALHGKAEPLQQRHPIVERTAPGRRHAVAANARHGAVDPLADREAAPAGRIADAQQQPAARLQCIAHAAQHALLRFEVDVVQHVEDHHQVAGRQLGRAHVGADEARRRLQMPDRRFGARHVLRHQLDAGVAARCRRGGPDRRAIRPAAPASRSWPTAGSRTGPARSRCRPRGRARSPIRPRSIRPRNTGSRPSLPRAKCQANLPAFRYGAVARSCNRRHAASVETAFAHAAKPSGRVTARKPSAADARQQRRQHLQHDRRALQRCARHCRRAAAGCRRPASPCVRRASTVAGIALRACRSRAASSSPATGPADAAPAPRKGLRKPAGARKQVGRWPVTSCSTCCAREISAAKPRGPSNEKLWRCRAVWFWMLWPRATISRASAGCASTRSAMQKKVARWPCASSRSSTCGVTSGSGPSSMVIATSRRAAAACGSRVTFGPSRLLRGVSPAAVISTWLSTTAPIAQGAAPGHQHGGTERRADASRRWRE